MAITVRDLTSLRYQAQVDEPPPRNIEAVIDAVLGGDDITDDESYDNEEMVPGTPNVSYSFRGAGTADDPIVFTEDDDDVVVPPPAPVRRTLPTFADMFGIPTVEDMYASFPEDMTVGPARLEGNAFFARLLREDGPVDEGLSQVAYNLLVAQEYLESGHLDVSARALNVAVELVDDMRDRLVVRPLGAEFIRSVRRRLNPDVLAEHPQERSI